MDFILNNRLGRAMGLACALVLGGCGDKAPEAETSDVPSASPVSESDNSSGASEDVKWVDLPALDFSVQACDDVRGVAVRYEELNPDVFWDALKVNYISSALAAENKHPYIFYETKYFPQTGPAFMQLAFAHECSHHIEGDVVNRANNNLGFSIDEEYRADCDGIEFLFNNRSFGQKEIDEIKRTFDAIAENFKESSPSQLASVEGRADRVQSCFDRLSR